MKTTSIAYIRATKKTKEDYEVIFQLYLLTKSESKKHPPRLPFADVRRNYQIITPHHEVEKITLLHHLQTIISIAFKRTAA